MIGISQILLRIWLTAIAIAGTIWIFYFVWVIDYIAYAIIGTVAYAILSLPIIFTVRIFFNRIINTAKDGSQFLLLLNLLIILSGSAMSLPVGSLFIGFPPFISLIGSAALCLPVSLGTFINRQSLVSLSNSSPIKLSEMETQQQAPAKANNKILYKGLITAALILLMLIPSSFLSNLVREREQRQESVVKEVAAKWSSAQTIAPPYIFIPYQYVHVNEKNERKVTVKQLVFVSDQLQVIANIVPEERKRSIYKVLLYRSDIRFNGKFKLQLPEGISQEQLLLNEAKICLGISDFKGVEEQIRVNAGSQNLVLKPGLPTGAVSSTGLSSKIALTAGDFNSDLAFSGGVKIKGSEELHFVPLSGNADFTVTSSWKHPSFNGNFLPTSSAKQKESGFTANWKFNPANLPFSSVLIDQTVSVPSVSFGVNMVQPANHYAKTERSVKYALLFIGLTFALFFVTELLQKKEVHPLQYTLVGFALLIFYSLLLSISEFLPFSVAYGIAAFATVSMITIYSYSHFKSVKIATSFAAVIGGLYAFIFVLINLEDTALLVGSIGLFIILAVLMYLSKKINWNPREEEPVLQ